MDQQYGEFVGLDSLHAAIITEDSEANYTTEVPEYLAPSAEISGEAETESTPVYYDNVPANTYNSEGATTLTITISGISAQKAAKYMGKKYDAASGRVLDDGQPNPPDIALSFRFNKGNNGFRYYQYLKGTFSGGTEEAATKTNSVDIRTYQMTFTAVSTTHEWMIDGEMKPLKRIFGDTADQAFNSANWFTQVQTPDTAATPTALNLVSSVPADDATAVAVDSDIVLTLNNKISNQTISLFTSTFASVLVTISKNTAGTVLTIAPNANLAAATTYLLVISNITDVYGQKIENQVITFTTA